MTVPKNSAKTSLWEKRPDGIVGAFGLAVAMHAGALTSVRWGLTLLAVAAVGAGCSLNPQPLPPDTEPGAAVNGDGGGNTDTGSGGHGDASFSGDGSVTQSGGDAGADSAGSIPNDGGPGADAQVDGADGADDAGDGAAEDGEGDALGEGD
jgi:hypothetical protein